MTLSGVISGGGATLTKAGAGTLTLAGANTYAGNTTVNAGTLLVANASGSGTGAGAVTVNTGATLGGTGAVAGAVTVNSGGTLRAGGAGGLGQLTLRGKTTLAGGSNFTTTLAGTSAGTQYGQLVITAGGSIDLGSATLAPTLSYTPSNTDKLFLIDNQNASGGLTGTFATLAQGADLHLRQRHNGADQLLRRFRNGPDHGGQRRRFARLQSGAGTGHGAGASGAGARRRGDVAAAAGERGGLIGASALGEPAQSVAGLALTRRLTSPVRQEPSLVTQASRMCHRIFLMSLR